MPLLLTYFSSVARPKPRMLLLLPTKASTVILEVSEAHERELVTAIAILEVRGTHERELVSVIAILEVRGTHERELVSVIAILEVREALK